MRVLTALLLLFLPLSSYASTQVQVSVAATNDDVYIDRHTASPFDTTAYLNDPIGVYLGHYSADYQQDGGFRFLSVAIPSGATIDSAWIVFASTGVQSGTTCNWRYRGEDTASAAIFSTVANWRTRILTTASVDSSSMAAYPADGVTVRSPLITSIVQEIVSRGDWSSGNNMAILVFNNSSSTGAYRKPESYEDAGTAPAQLNIWYTASGGGGGADSSKTSIHSPANTYKVHSPAGIGAIHKP